MTLPPSNGEKPAVRAKDALWQTSSPWRICRRMDMNRSVRHGRGRPRALQTPLRPRTCSAKLCRHQVATPNSNINGIALFELQKPWLMDLVPSQGTGRSSGQLPTPSVRVAPKLLRMDIHARWAVGQAVIVVHPLVRFANCASTLGESNIALGLKEVPLDPPNTEHLKKLEFKKMNRTTKSSLKTALALQKVPIPPSERPMLPLSSPFQQGIVTKIWVSMNWGLGRTFDRQY